MMNPRKEPQAKPVRIRIEVGGEEHSSIKSLKDKIEINDVLINDVYKLYKDGSFIKWLNGIGETIDAKIFEELKNKNLSDDKDLFVFEMFKKIYIGTPCMDLDGFDQIKDVLMNNDNPQIRPVDRVLIYMLESYSDIDFFMKMYLYYHNEVKYQWEGRFSVIKDNNILKFVEYMLSNHEYCTLLYSIDKPVENSFFTDIIELLKNRISEDKCAELLILICEQFYNNHANYWNDVFKSCDDKSIKYRYAMIVFQMEQEYGNSMARAFLYEAIDYDEELKEYLAEHYPATNVKPWIVEIIDHINANYSWRGKIVKSYFSQKKSTYPLEKCFHEYKLIELMEDIYKIVDRNECSAPSYCSIFNIEVLFWKIVTESWYATRNNYDYSSEYYPCSTKPKNYLKRKLEKSEFSALKDYPLIKDILEGNYSSSKIGELKINFFEQMFKNNPSLYAYFNYE